MSSAAVARIRLGEAGDAPTMLALFDEAVAWLVARGQPGQWGTEPWSARPNAVARARQWASGPGLRIAEAADGTPLGALVLVAECPPHVARIHEPERYIDALVTSRRHAGLGVGAALVAAAVDEARAAGVPVLRVDCWAEAPALVAWYERQGFARAGGFDVDGWRGQVLSMRLPRGRPAAPVSIDRLETARLTAERLVPAHEPEIAALLGDPRVGETLGGVRDRAEAAERLAHHVAHWERHGFGYWLWRDRVSGAFVARGGLQRATVGGREEVEVGWAVVPERWGEGLATELARASVGVAFDQLGLDDVVAFTLPDNVASLRVMEKAGFRYEREVVHADLAHVLYRIRAGVPAGPGQPRH